MNPNHEVLTYLLKKVSALSDTVNRSSSEWSDTFAKFEDFYPYDGINHLPKLTDADFRKANDLLYNKKQALTEMIEVFTLIDKLYKEQED